MIFRHLGVSVGNNTGIRTDDEQLKSITLRFPENELGLYDALAKAMGLSRQDFMQHLIRATFNTAGLEFARGYLESNPAISLRDFLFAQTESGEVKGSIVGLLKYIEGALAKEEEDSVLATQLAIDSGQYDYPFPPPEGLYEVSK